MVDRNCYCCFDPLCCLSLICEFIDLGFGFSVQILFFILYFYNEVFTQFTQSRTQKWKSFSTHPHFNGKSGEVLWSTKHLRGFAVKISALKLPFFFLGLPETWITLGELYGAVSSSTSSVWENAESLFCFEASEMFRRASKLQLTFRRREGKQIMTAFFKKLFGEAFSN